MELIKTEESMILASQANQKAPGYDFVKSLQNCYAKLENYKHYNAWLNLVKNHQEVVYNPQSLLNRVFYAVKDNINVKNTITTGGSKFFANYVSPYNATVIDLLNQAGAIPVCKANLDEFGLGGTGLFSGFANVINPYDRYRIPGGSSSGSAVLVALKLVAFALGTDTGDSIRMPAAFLKIYGFKPTYGLISRYGVFPYSPSLDHVGVLANSITDIAIVMDAIQQHDPQDFTSQPVKFHFYQNLNKPLRRIKVAFCKNLIALLDKPLQTLFYDFLKKAANYYDLFEADYPLDLLKQISSVYQILSYAEAVSCYQNITGINFGEKLTGDDFAAKAIATRTKNFGMELKKRFVLGSYCTLASNYEKIFLKVKKIRRLIVEEMEKIFQECDCVFMPANANIAPLISAFANNQNPFNVYDNYLQIANFGGFPSITIPNYSYQNHAIGLNIAANINQDAALLALAKQVDKLIKNNFA